MAIDRASLHGESNAASIGRDCHRPITPFDTVALTDSFQALVMAVALAQAAGAVASGDGSFRHRPCI